MKSKNLTKVLALTCAAGAIAIGCAQPRYDSAALAFNSWCSDETPSIETKKTVKALLEAAGQKECLDAGQVLSSRTSLDLSGKELRDIQPITAFKQLEKLDLSNNFIDNIEPLAELKKLKELNVSGNSSLDADHIARGLKGIKSLKLIVANGMSGAEVSTLKRVIGILDLKVRDNLPSIKEKPELSLETPEASPESIKEEAEETDGATEKVEADIEITSEESEISPKSSDAKSDDDSEETPVS